MSGKATFFVVTTLASLGWAVYLYSQMHSLYGQVGRLDKAQATLGEQLNVCRTTNAQLENQVNSSSRSLAELRKRGDVIYNVGLLIRLTPVQLNPSSDSPAPETNSLNLGAVATFLSADGQAIRFTNPDLLATLKGDELQIAFEPENPASFSRRQIGELARFNKVQIDFSSIFPLAGLSLSKSAVLGVTLRVNDLNLIEKQASLSDKGDPALRFSVDLSDETPNIEKLYTQALRAEAAPTPNPNPS
jgi:hypothetical protein